MRMIRILAIILLAAAAMAGRGTPSLADDAQNYILFAAPGGEGRYPWAEAIPTSILEGARDAQVWSRISLRQDSRQVVGPATVLMEDHSQRIWERNTDSHAWHWRAAEDVPPVLVDEESMVQVSWSNPQGFFPPTVSVDMTIAPDGETAPKTLHWLHLTPEQGTADLNRQLYIQGDPLVPKTTMYLIARELGRPAGDAWQWKRDRENLVLQKRVHIPFDEAGYLSIAHDPDLDISRVQLSVDSDALPGRDAFLLWEQLTHWTQTSGNEDLLVINLHDALAKAATKGRPPVIMEVIIFVRTSLKTFLATQPIHKAFFYSLPATALAPRSVSSGGDHFLLCPIQDTGVTRGTLTEVRVTMKHSAPFAAEDIGLALKTSHLTRVPALARSVEKAASDWLGGAVWAPFREVWSFRPVWFETGRTDKEKRLRLGLVKDAEPRVFSRKADLGSILHGRLCLGLAGDTGQGFTDAEVRFSMPDGQESRRVFSREGSGGIVDAPPGARLKDVVLDTERSRIPGNYAAALFEARFLGGQTPEPPATWEWWEQRARAPFVPDGFTAARLENDTLLLVPTPGGENRWFFSLGGARMLTSTILVMPRNLPGDCMAWLWLGQDRYPVPMAPEVSFVIPERGHDAGDIRFELQYLGDEPLLAFTPPAMAGLGVRRSTQGLFRNVGFALGRDRLVPRDDYTEDGWYFMGSRRLPPDGVSLHADHDAAFDMDAVLVRAADPVPWPMARSDRKVPDQGRFERYAGIVGLFLSALLLWAFRRKLRALLRGAVAPSCPRGALSWPGLAPWMAGAAVCYLGWLFVGQGSVQTLLSLGSLCLAFACVRLGGAVESRLRNAFGWTTDPGKDSCRVLRGNACMAVGLMALAAVSASCGLAQLAETLCVVLYCLAVLTLIAVIEAGAAKEGSEG